MFSFDVMIGAKNDRPNPPAVIAAERNKNYPIGYLWRANLPIKKKSKKGMPADMMYIPNLNSIFNFDSYCHRPNKYLRYPT